MKQPFQPWLPDIEPAVEFGDMVEHIADYKRTIVADRSVILTTGNSVWNSLGPAIGASRIRFKGFFSVLFGTVLLTLFYLKT